MDTLGEGLDAFESEICAHSVLEVVKAYPDGASRRVALATGELLLPAAHYDSPPVIRVAIAGVPAWARRVRAVPAIALALWTAAGISVGAMHVLTLRVPVPAPAPPPALSVPRPAAAPTLVTVIVEPLPELPAKE